MFGRVVQSDVTVAGSPGGCGRPAGRARRPRRGLHAAPGARPSPEVPREPVLRRGRAARRAPAATAAATAPSTSGASVSSTRSRRSSGSRSRASSAESTALPRSMSTSTPSSDQASSMARATSTASVPSGRPGWSRPAAAAICRPAPPICAASSTTPSASLALCETMTRPITARRPRGLPGHRRRGVVSRGARFSPARVAAAVSSSSQDDVAPGSWWPALRSPR